MTRQQEWARGSLERVSAYAPRPDGPARDGASEYRTLCMKMPILLKQSGLSQALAFVRSRGDLGKAFCDDLSAVLAPAEATVGSGQATAKSAGHQLQERAFTAKDLGTYMSLSRDVIAVSIWFRRFAQSELPAADAQ